MNKKAYVRPSKESSAVMVVMGVLFLGMGVFICLASEGEARVYAMMFLLIWIVACGSMIVYGLSIIFSKSPPAVTEVELPMGPFEVDLTGGDKGPQTGGYAAGVDFETKLRKLESLLKEGLISEKEYKKKRAQIMNEKW